MFRRLAFGLVAVVVVGLGATPAAAYDFEIRALTVGQGYQLRSFRLLSGDLLLKRRRFTQSLTLNIWNIGRESSLLQQDPRAVERGAHYYFTSYLRVDHDFGEYTGDDILIGTQRFSAADLIPELSGSNLALDVLYAYAGGENVAGFLDFEIGRQLVVDSLDWFSFDGLTLRAHTPWHLTAEAFGGARVRDSSPVGSAAQEPDGTGSSECAEYVEGNVPGSGAWRPIDRPVANGENPFESEFDVCPQRDEVMPTFGGAVQTAGLPVLARLSYRRSMSRTPGLIGPADRFANPDVGFYPNEFDQAPAWGVNEERLTLSVRANWWYAKGRGQLTPYAAARYSAVHGLMDEAQAGLRWAHGSHALTPEYYYSFPTFDADSIFNVFSTQPYHDLRVTYELRPRAAALSAYARGWMRRFQIEAEDVNDAVGASDLAGGGQIGGRYRHADGRFARVDLFLEDGYGGRRVGGYGVVSWRLNDHWDVAGRLSVIQFDEDVVANLNGTSLGAQMGASYLVADGIALHLNAEENHNRFYDSQFRLIGVLDLAFQPEI